MNVATLPRCRIVNPVITMNEDDSITGEYTPDSGDLALHTVDFSDPMWALLPSVELDRSIRCLYTTPARTLALRMYALVMLTHHNQDVHSLVRSRSC